MEKKKITLKDFLDLHQGGTVDECISIYAGLIDQKQQHVYCEEEQQSVVLDSKWFDQIKNQEVVRFCLNNANPNCVELCIEIVSKEA